MNKSTWSITVTASIITVVAVLGVLLSRFGFGNRLKTQLAAPASVGACYGENNTCQPNVTKAQCGVSPGVNKRLFIPGKACAPAPFKLVSMLSETAIGNYPTGELKSSWEEQTTAAQHSADQSCIQKLYDGVYGLNNSQGKVNGEKICTTATTSPYAQIIEYPQVTDQWGWPWWTSSDRPDTTEVYYRLAACSIVVRCNQPITIPLNYPISTPGSR